MTSPATPIDTAASEQPANRWHDITSSASNDPTAQARIDTAARLADAAIAAAAREGWARPDTAGPDVLDASQAWARIALLWHQVLTDTDAFTAARISMHTVCRQDPDTTRQWLTGADGTATMATTLGLDEYFDLYGFDKFDRLTKLLSAAQDAHVFGVDGHRVDLIHEAGDHGYVDTHRVTLTTPQHGTLCSAPIDSLALFTDHLAGPDAAVHALSVIAEHTDELLRQRALFADRSWPAPERPSRPDQGQRPAARTTVDTARPTVDPPTRAAVSLSAARAFRPLASDAQPALPTSTPTPEPAIRNGRRR